MCRYSSDTRVIFQARSKFWVRDQVSPNMTFEDWSLDLVWSTGDAVKTGRGLLVGTASGVGSGARAPRECHLT